MQTASITSHATVHRSPYLYSSHPHAVIAANGDIIVVFNQTRRNRFIFHPPHDPEYRNMLTRSSDSGAKWSAPQVVPNYDYAGTECAGLTRLSCDRILLNQWRNRWYPLGLARSYPVEPMQFPDEFVAELIESAELDTGAQISGSPEEFAPWARGHGHSYGHASDDHGESFAHTTIIDTGPFHGGYGLRGCVELPDGRLVLPLNDIPEFRTIFTVVSDDRGASWHTPQLVAQAEGRLFTEPAMALAANGDLVCMIRDDTTHIMHSCHSADGGKSWSAVEATGIDGYPPHLLVLPDGRIICTYGMRRTHYSIRAVLSEDHGRSWSVGAPIIIRGNLLNRDLGYPSTVQLDDESLLTFYYCQDEEGVTGIESTRWAL